MLLIRPWIAMNRNHFGGIHTASFIFAVSNIGGELLPVGPSIAVAACLISPRQIHRANEFTLAPIKEAAWIFLGIFGTTIPVLDYMAMHAVQLGLRSDLQF
jgi:Putative citrate transport